MKTKIAAAACCALLLSASPAVADDRPYAGVTYAGYRADQSPLDGRFPSPQQVDEDMALLAQLAPRIRTYSAREGDNNVPAAAGRQGLSVIAGAWISGSATADRAELEALLVLAEEVPAITHVVVGNETQLRGDVSTGRLALMLEEVRGRTDKPVSTAEPWGTWMAHPQLAQHVDFIAAHVLPYWEDVAIEDAVDYVFRRVEELKLRFPDKRVVVTETGWPSGGETRGRAVASPENHERFMREFTARAKAAGLDYLIIEGFDQKWKAQQEGVVGAYWGLFHADRTLKFSLP